MQSLQDLTQNIYLRPKDEDRDTQGLKNDEILERACPLYGICDPGDCWSATLDQHMREDFCMTPLKSDAAVYTVSKDASVIGARGRYVDDCLNIGNDKFRVSTNTTLKRFNSKPRKDNEFEFYSAHFLTTVAGHSISHWRTTLVA